MNTPQGSTPTFGDELREKLTPIFDDLAEKRCCEHGINNSVKANDEAFAAMRPILNDLWLRAGNARELTTPKTKAKKWRDEWDIK